MRDMTYTETKLVVEALEAKGHRWAGRESHSRTARGAYYTYLHCGNGRCHVQAEFSLERSKLTKSTIGQFRCSYE
jgi:hypothetical protein